jgi:hypothetical protein
MTSIVDFITLCVEHIEGYAGVMIGILCARSPGYNWKRFSGGARLCIGNNLTLGFHTRTFRGPPSMCRRITGCGHDLH